MILWAYSADHHCKDLGLLAGNGLGRNRARSVRGARAQEGQRPQKGEPGKCQKADDTSVRVVDQSREAAGKARQSREKAEQPQNRGQAVRTEIVGEYRHSKGGAPSATDPQRHGRQI